ncbi:MAG: carboxymuconolactone decarboxylase family protein [Bauldia sp.]|nr:carboxymuconolactone decarboxylase family protein [Bauldia sp.]
MALTSRQEEVKAEFVRERGVWGEVWECFLQLDPEFLSAYLDYYMVPWRKGHLDARTREFIYIGLDAAATHLYEPGLRLHIREALKLGASAGEIVEVIELASTLGIHSVTVGMPILTEVLARHGLRDGPAPLTERQEALKAAFVEKRGYWSSSWDETLELDPDLFEAYTRFSSLAARSGLLSTKSRELICLAFNVATTHLYEPSIRLHFDNALTAGATLDEILETIEIASVIGLHAATMAMPILADELARAAKAKDQ